MKMFMWEPLIVIGLIGIMVFSILIQTNRIENRFLVSGSLIISAICFLAGLIGYNVYVI